MLTGWTYDRSTVTFSFRPEWHDPGPAQVMGWSTEGATGAGAVADGEALVRYLARHPATARRVARALCVRFVADQPPSTLVRSAASVYLANGTAIAPVLRHTFRSDGFRAAVGRKVRRPDELVTAALRTGGLGVDTAAGPGGQGSLLWWLQRLDHVPFRCEPPTGYSDQAADWLAVSQLTNQWELTLGLAYGWLGGITQPRGWRSFTGGRTPATGAELVDVVSGQILQQRLPDADRRTILSAVGMTPASRPNEAWLQGAVPQVAALVLGSPYGQLR